MRKKMYDAHAKDVPELFGLKHDAAASSTSSSRAVPVRGHAHRHAELTATSATSPLLRIARGTRPDRPGAGGGGRQRLREYRRLQHALRLTATPKARVPRELVDKHVAAVDALWQAVFGQPQP
jgi:glutamate-ammonia-ligase adenylyltransferase